MPPTGSRRTISGGQDFRTRMTKAGLPLFHALACFQVPRRVVLRGRCAFIPPLLVRTSYLNTYFNLISA